MVRQAASQLPQNAGGIAAATKPSALCQDRKLTIGSTPVSLAESRRWGRYSAVFSLRGDLTPPSDQWRVFARTSTNPPPRSFPRNFSAIGQGVRDGLGVGLR